MRKLIGAGLLLVVGCRSSSTTSTTTTAPAPATSTAAPTASNTAAGAATPTDALNALMAAVKAEDLQAFGAVWGTKDGSVREQWSRQEFEMRAYYNIKCLRNDSFTVVNTDNVVGGNKIMQVQLKRGSIVAMTKFTLVPTASGRWFVQMFDSAPLVKICQSA